MPRRAEFGRVILLVEERPYLWGILKARISSATAYVRSAHPSELAASWSRCQPWPWVVVEATGAPLPDLDSLIGDRPVPVHRLGWPPDGWEGLVTELSALDGLSIGGVRLFRNRGLLTPDGRLVRDLPELEGLLAAGARGVHWQGDLERMRRRLEFHRLPIEVRLEHGRAYLVGAPAAPGV